MLIYKIYWQKTIPTTLAATMKHKYESNGN